MAASASEANSLDVPATGHIHRQEALVLAPSGHQYDPGVAEVVGLPASGDPAIQVVGERRVLRNDAGEADEHAETLIDEGHPGRGALAGDEQRVAVGPGHQVVIGEHPG